MRHLIAASLLAAIGLASTQAQAALAPREAFNQACKSIKGQAPDSGPQVVQAKPAVKAIMGVLGGTNCDEMTKKAAALTELDVSGKEIVDISVTAFMTNLTTLNISNNKLTRGKLRGGSPSIESNYDIDTTGLCTQNAPDSAKHPLLFNCTHYCTC